MISVDFSLGEKDEFRKDKLIQEFLAICFREYAATYGIEDYWINYDNSPRYGNNNKE